MFNKIPLAVENHSKSKKTSPNLIEEAMFLSAHESHIQQKLKPTKATAFEPVFWLGCLHRTTFFFQTRRHSKSADEASRVRCSLVRMAIRSSQLPVFLGPFPGFPVMGMGFFELRFLQLIFFRKENMGTHNFYDFLVVMSRHSFSMFWG